MILKNHPVACHTDNVGPNSTFVAIKGFNSDGNKFITKAIEQGATQIVLTKNSSNQKLEKQYQNIKFIYTKNTRIKLAQLSAKALNYPANKLKIIGITGTKGKTTTSYIIEHVLRNCGLKIALLGSIKNKILTTETQSKLTCPESNYLHMFFDECVKQNIDYVVMEVSSHALSLDRTYGIKFNAVGFTNLAPEHMDFYKDMQEYFQAKYLLFDQAKKEGAIIINSDDAWGKKALNNLKNKDNNILGFDNKTFSIEQNNINGLEIKIKNNVIIAPKLFGQFNAYNLVMSFLICQKLGLKDNKIIDAIKTFPGVPGRLQIHTLKNNAKAFVDYAHNPSSMEAVLSVLRTMTKNLIVVFGCGGDRDKTKRPVMGKISTQYADKIIITDDNPRSENRENILKDILAGIEKKDLNKVTCLLDRKKAIAKAVQFSNPNSIIALLGKGHEDYYLINNKKFYLDDYKEIEKY